MLTAINIIVVNITIERSEASLLGADNSLLLWGRRKTGKTFLVKRSILFDVYVYCKRGGGFYLEGAPFETLDDHDQMLHLIKGWSKEGKCIILDEFQRLPSGYLDVFANLERNGRIVLTGSSLHTVKDVISAGSPVLGLFADLRLSLIRPLDILKGLAKHMSLERSFQLAPYLRDPWTIQYMTSDDLDLTHLMLLSRSTVRGLVGEVFLEEDRSLTQVYEGVLRALSRRIWKPSEISDLLFSRGIIKKPDPHLIAPYIANMEAMDLIVRTPIYGKKQIMNRIRSPAIAASYLLDERLNHFQQDLSPKFISGVLEEAHPIYFEHFIGDFIVQAYSGVGQYFLCPDFDIDIIVTRGKKVVCCGEVKSGSVRKEDVDQFLERTRHLKGDKIVFSPSLIEDDRIVSLTPDNALDWFERVSGG